MPGPIAARTYQTGPKYDDVKKITPNAIQHVNRAQLTKNFTSSRFTIEGPRPATVVAAGR